MNRRTEEPPLQARIHADVNREDRLAFNLTGRQLTILAVTGLVLYTAWTVVATTVHPLVFTAAAVPVAGGAFFLAVGRRDGVSLDRWLLHGWRHRRTPHHLVPVDGPPRPAPAWVTTTAGRLPLPAPLRLPAKGVTADGRIDLGPDGATVLVAASTVAFGLRSPGEQNALVGGFARWLHALDGPTQILIRAQRVDLTGLAGRIANDAPGLPHPALEQAATSHVEFLHELAAQRELLHRQVTIALRGKNTGHGIHRAGDTVRALTGCEVTAHVQDGPQAAETLTECLDPGRPAPLAALARAGEPW